MINQFIPNITGALATTSQQFISEDVGILVISVITTGIMIGFFIGLFTRATYWVWR